MILKMFSSVEPKLSLPWETAPEVVQLKGAAPQTTIFEGHEEEPRILLWNRWILRLVMF